MNTIGVSGLQASAHTDFSGCKPVCNYTISLQKLQMNTGQKLAGIGISLFNQYDRQLLCIDFYISVYQQIHPTSAQYHIL